MRHRFLFLFLFALLLADVFPAFAQQVIMGSPAECASVPDEIEALNQNEAEANNFCSAYISPPTFTVVITEVGASSLPTGQATTGIWSIG